MVDVLPENPEIHLMKSLLSPEWDESRVNGFDINASDGDPELLKTADSFDKLGEYYPQFTVQMAGDESPPTETGYEFLGTNGPGSNPTNTLTAQARVEDSDTAYTNTRSYGDGTYNTSIYGEYKDLTADDLVELIRKEIDRICNSNPTGGNTEFSFVSSHHSQVPDTGDSTQPVRRDGAIISYGWIKE